MSVLEGVHSEIAAARAAVVDLLRRLADDGPLATHRVYVGAVSGKEFAPGVVASVQDIAILRRAHANGHAEPETTEEIVDAEGTRCRTTSWAITPQGVSFLATLPAAGEEG